MIPTLSASDRSVCARRIQQLRDRIADDVTEMFLRRHADWLERYGERARAHGVEDARFHLDFLAGAVEAGSTEAFADYARWCRRVLQARGIAPPFVAENLGDIGETLAAAIPEFAGALREVVAAGRAACAAPGAGAIRPDAAPLGDARAVFTRAALRGDRRAALAIAREVLRSSTAFEVYSGIFEPSQHEVGRLWEANQISVAQEHLATAVTQHVMASLFAELAPATPGRGGVIVTGIEGEHHQIAGHMVADALALDGWDVQFLGTNLPARDIVRAILESRPVLVGISATMLFNLPRVSALVGAIREAAPETRIIAGGAAFAGYTSAADALGCEGIGRNLVEARVLAEQLAARA